MADDTNVTIDSLYLFIPNLIPIVETQLTLNEATEKKYKVSFDEYYTERRVLSDLLVQHGIGSAQRVDSPKYLICVHQSRIRSDTPNKNKNNAIFDNLDLHVEIDGQRYPRDSVPVNYEENDYIEQKKDSKLIFKEYIGEPILKPFISNPDMKKILFWNNRFKTSTSSYTAQNNSTISRIWY